MVNILNVYNCPYLTTLGEPQLGRTRYLVNLVSATLTSTNQEMFEKIHRTKIKLKDVVEGLIKFRREAEETILNIELMVLEGINDDNETIY